MIWLLRLIRWKNLVILLLTQLGVYIFLQRHNCFQFEFSKPFLWVVLATLLLAAAGYIINDYFDIKIDAINKPHKMVVNKYISRRQTLFLHFILSTIGVFIGFYLHWKLGALFGIVAFVLWSYSVKFKHLPWIGNLVIATLLALSVFVVYLAEYSTDGRWVAFYALFAFLTNLSREMVKDMEDIEGDKHLGCRTVPIIFGIPKTKKIVYLLLAGTIALIVLSFFYITYREYWLILSYLVITVALPLIYLLHLISMAQTKKDFSRISLYLKLIMLAGILSMPLRCLT